MSQVDAALFYSPRSAAIFRDWRCGRRLAVDRIIAVCISPAAAAALAPLAFRELRIAARPNQAKSCLTIVLKLAYFTGHRRFRPSSGESDACGNATRPSHFAHAA